MFTTEPLISVITITYNAASTLMPTLNSIKEQTFSDFEHIIVDGSSKDATLAIARANGVEGLRIISEKDNGLYDAMNKGLHMARGKYVLFLNSGDAFHDKETLKAYAEAIKKNDEPDIIYGETIFVDEARQYVSPRHLRVPPRLTFESFADGMLICHQAFMVKRALAPDYDLKYRYSADYDWTIRCICKTKPEKCVNLKRVVIDYLVGGLTEKRHMASLKERFEIMCRHYGTAPTLGRHVKFLGRAIKRKIGSKAALKETI